MYNLLKNIIASLVLMISLSLPAFAAPVTYIYQGFNASGSLGGIAFSNVDFTVTAQADTDNIEPWFSGGQVTHFSATIDIVGFSTAEILTASHSWYTHNNLGTSGNVGLGEDLYSNWMTFFADPAFANYDLSTSIGPVYGTFTHVWQFVNVSTSPGILSFSNDQLEGSFQATVVPIPPAIWLFGSGLFGLIGLARRKAL